MKIMASDEGERGQQQSALEMLQQQWPELPHVLACNGLTAATAAQTRELEACFGGLSSIALLPPVFAQLTSLRLVQQV